MQGGRRLYVQNDGFCCRRKKKFPLPLILIEFFLFLNKEIIWDNKNCLTLPTSVRYNQCDQIGRFLKVLGAKFLTKVAQNIWPLIWAIVKNGSFTLNCCGYFLGYFLLQHLVTLGTIQNITASLITKSSSCYGQKSVSRGPASCRLK